MQHTSYIRVALLSLVCSMAVMIAGCDDEKDDSEFPNWQQYNAEQYEEIYRQATQRIAQGDATWKVLHNYTFIDEVNNSPSDYIVVHVLNEGTGEGSPLFTDSVRVHYRGRLLPSTSYADGLVFDETWLGDYDLETMYPVKLGVASLIDGFSTALQHMHIGDRWEVYIPCQLGYGTKKQDQIPAYSTLKFDITLMAYYRPGKPVPEWKAPRRR